jgi:hypothetical protein
MYHRLHCRVAMTTFWRTFLPWRKNQPWLVRGGHARPFSLYLPSSNVKDIETKAEGSFDLGFVFDIEAKGTFLFQNFERWKRSEQPLVQMFERSKRNKEPLVQRFERSKRKKQFLYQNWDS